MKGLPSGPVTLPAMVAPHALDARPTRQCQRNQNSIRERHRLLLSVHGLADRFAGAGCDRTGLVVCRRAWWTLRFQAATIYNESQLRGKLLDFELLHLERPSEREGVDPSSAVT